MNSLSDNQLMHDVRNGDVQKLGVLFERYNIILFNFILKLTSNKNFSEDLVQEVFLRILKYRHTFRGDGKFISWMYHIARNAHIDCFRKQKKDNIVDKEQDDPVCDNPDPGNKLEQDEETKLLLKALALLPNEKREVLVLSRFQKMKYEDIAELLSCRVGTIKARVHRAIKDLRVIYFELSGENVL